MWCQKGQKEQVNLFIELEKHKLNQIDGRNIRTSLQKRDSFLEVKAMVSLE